MGAFSLLAILILLVVLASILSFSDSERFGWVGRLIAMLLVGGIAATLLLGFFTARSTSGRTKQTRCLQNLSQMGKAAALYASDHNEQLPTSFAAMTNYIDNPKVFRCPEGHATMGNITNVDVWSDYILVTNANPSNSTDVLVYCNPSNHSGTGVNVLFVDCSVQWCTPFDFPSLGADIARLSRAMTNSAKGM